MNNKKAQLMPDEDLSLFTKKKKPVLPDSDDEDFGFERPKFTRRGSATMPEVNEDTFDMEKYRPHNYEIGRPKGDDINDLMDYYSKFKMTRNAIGRTNVGARPSFNGNHNDDFYDDQEDFSLPPRQKKFSDPEQQFQPEDDIPQAPPRKKFSDPEDYSLPVSRLPPRSALDFGDSIDPATKLILMRNTDPAPNRMARNYDEDFSPEPRRNFSNQQRFGGGDDDMSYLRPSPPPQTGSADTAMSSHTRMMLDKLKQSTAQLQDLTEGGEEAFVPPQRGNRQHQQQKKSRFMRRAGGGGEEAGEAEETEKYYSSLANNVLGLRNDTMGDFDKFRPDPLRISPPKRPTRKNYDFDEEPAGVQQRKFVDEDDTDAMIANLKQKTTRRAATDILRDIEADTDQDRVKFEPVKSFKDSFRSEAESDMKFGSLNRMSSMSSGKQKKKSYLEQDDTPNPFSSLRSSQAMEPPSEGMFGGRYGGKKQAGYGLDDEDGGYGGGGGYGRQPQVGYGGGQQNYGSLGRNFGGHQHQPQQQPQHQQFQQQPQPGQMMQQQMGSLYGDGGAGYGQDMYGMQGGYGGAPMQYPPMYGQPQVQQGYGGYGGMGGGQGYDQMGYGGGGGMAGMGYGGVQQQQPPGANLRQVRHQRYGGQNSSGW